mgnify:CR=1 FL=1
MSYALITGASGGIGLDLAALFAKKGIDIVLVARSSDKLNAIKTNFEKEYHINVTVITKDLSEPYSAESIYSKIQEMNISVEYLVNNAGFGDWGKFSETSPEKQHRMMYLNMISLTMLSKLFLKDMLSNNCGKILNIASTAAFQPGPFMAVYYATKAYVLSFSEAISEELKGTGVTVTTLCPGPTKTGFEDAAGLNDSKLFKMLKPAPSQKVAEYGFQAMIKGKRTAVFGFQNKLMIFFDRFVPKFIILKMVRSIQGN